MTLAASASARPRVVVADDSALMRRLVGDVLTRGGFDVVATARDGDEALKECRHHRPDAMTLDLSMPGMGGIDVLRTMRGENLDLPVVVVSAFSPAQGAYAVDALAEGAFELVTKPTGLADAPVFEQTLLGRVTLAVTSRRQASLLRLAPAARTLTPPWSRAAAPAPAAPVAPPLRRPSARGAKVVLIAISTGGPKALAALLPELPSPLGARHDDRAAHARRLHRVARRSPEPREHAHRQGGRRRGDARPRRRAARPGRPAPADGRRRPHPAQRRRPGSAACGRVPTSRSKMRPAVTATACCSWS